MRRLLAIAAVISGLLLILVPRYILPACEYEGFSRMHCSDTAEAERVLAGLFLAVGAALFFLKQRWAVLSGSLICAALSVAAYIIPDSLGYCHSSKMPCNYGMVPAIRFIAIASGLMALTVVAAELYAGTKKGKA